MTCRLHVVHYIPRQSSGFYRSFGDILETVAGGEPSPPHQAGAVSKATRTESDSGTKKLSFSKPITRPERSFISTTSSPVSSATCSSEGSVN